MRNYFYIVSGLFFLFTSCNKNVNQTEINDDSRSRIIQASKINRSMEKGENIVYNNATVIGDINFTKAKNKNIVNANLENRDINSSLVFYNCTFKGKVIASESNQNSEIHSTFNKNLTFINCTFQDTVNFSSAYFKDDVNFSNSVFQEFVNFKSVKSCTKGFYFYKSHFIKYAKFNLMNIGGDCNFSDAVFDDNAMFQLSVFKGITQFNAAKFNKNANFTKSKFKDDVFFNYAEFYKTVQFNTSVFTGRAEFLKCKFNMISEFKNCLFFSFTKFSDAEVTGIITFENSIFYISDPKKFNFKLSEESDLLSEKTQVLLKNRN